VTVVESVARVIITFCRIVCVGWRQKASVGTQQQFCSNACSLEQIFRNLFKKNGRNRIFCSKFEEKLNKST
jgi:hypothetical protein